MQAAVPPRSLFNDHKNMICFWFPFCFFFTKYSFLPLNVRKEREGQASENGLRLIMALKKFSADYNASLKASISYLFSYRVFSLG